MSGDGRTALLIMDMQRGVVSRLDAAAPLPARLAEAALSSELPHPAAATAAAAAMPIATERWPGPDSE